MDAISYNADMQEVYSPVVLRHPLFLKFALEDEFQLHSSQQRDIMHREWTASRLPSAGAFCTSSSETFSLPYSVEASVFSLACALQTAVMKLCALSASFTVVTIRTT
eukprot:4281819-Amphidinium_carterae.2